MFSFQYCSSQWWIEPFLFSYWSKKNHLHVVKFPPSPLFKMLKNITSFTSWSFLRRIRERFKIPMVRLKFSKFFIVAFSNEILRFSAVVKVVVAIGVWSSMSLLLSMGERIHSGRSDSKGNTVRIKSAKVIPSRNTMLLQDDNYSFKEFILPAGLTSVAFWKWKLHLGWFYKMKKTGASVCNLYFLFKIAIKYKCVCILFPSIFQVLYG